MSEDTACLLVIASVAYVGWYIWDRLSSHDDSNPFDGFGW